ncbi:MAG: MATE family efflux transporter [Anaerovoracaceae bacterium]
MERENKLGIEPINKLILTMALPAVAAQLVNVFYNIVDRMYIGHIADIGPFALTGLGLCLPITMGISAFSAFVGAGGAPLAAIELGRKNKEQAERILGNGVTMIVTLSIILSVVIIIAKKPLLYAFGASDITYTYANEYLSIYGLGTIFVMISLGLNNFIICQGQSKTAMISVLIGAALNIILDPIFIFLLDMGVTGAAIATVISQFVSSVWIVRFLISKKSEIKIKKQNLKVNPKVLAAIMALGISPFIMQITESIVNITFNVGLQKYGGDLYVGAMTIMQSVMQLVVIPVMGLTQGTQPIISYNYGANNFDRVKEAFKKILIITVLITTAATLCAWVFPQIFARIFTTNGELIDLVSKLLPIFMAGIFIFGVQMACQSAFMGMGQAKISLFLALLRKVFLLIPLAIILPMFVGVKGIIIAEPISDIIAAVTTGTIFLLYIKKLFRNQNKSEIN